MEIMKNQEPLNEYLSDHLDKAMGQFNMRLNVLMAPLERYGQRDYVTQAKKEILNLAFHFHYTLEGADIPPYDNPNLHYTP